MSSTFKNMQVEKGSGLASHKVIHTLLTSLRHHGFGIWAYTGVAFKNVRQNTPNIHRR